ncbi:TPA: DUF2523 family protein [Photobacterium damselae]
MRILIVFALFFPAAVFASPLDDVYSVITGVPSFLQEMFAYLIEYTVYLKFYFLLQSVEFAYGVAQSLISNLGLMDLVNSALGNLTIQQRNILETYGAREGLVILINSMMTRFVLNFMGA